MVVSIAPSPTNDLTERGRTGHHENRDIGLTYMNARYYIPGLGRFLTADTLVPAPANPQSHNRYSYVLGNPLVLVDPTGHASCYAHGQNEHCTDDTPMTPPPPRPQRPAVRPVRDIPQCDGCYLYLRSPITLTEWEIRLLIMIVYWETGSESVEQIEAVIWTILNRHAEGSYGSLEKLLLSGQYHAASHLNRWREQGLTGEDLANTAWNEFYGPHLYETERSVRQVVDSYAFADDPTNGGKFFIHVSPRWAEWYYEGIKRMAANDGISNQLSIERFNPKQRMILIVNNLYAPPYEDKIREALGVSAP